MRNDLGQSGMTNLGATPDYVLKKRMEDQLNVTGPVLREKPRAISEVLERLAGNQSRLRVLEARLNAVAERALGEMPPTESTNDYPMEEPTSAVHALIQAVEQQQIVVTKLDQHLERLERFV